MGQPLARAFGIHGVGFLPWSGARVPLDGVRRGARAVIVLASAAAIYLFTVGLCAAGEYIKGELVMTSRIEVEEGSRAEAAGLKSGDEILSIGGHPVSTFDDVPPLVQAYPEKPVTFVVHRGDETLDIVVTPRLVGGIPRIGVTATGPVTRPVSVIRAAGHGLARPFQVLARLLGVLSELAKDRPAVTLGSSVALQSAVRKAAAAGTGELVSFLGVLNSYYWLPLVALAAAMLPRKARPTAPDREQAEAAPPGPRKKRKRAKQSPRASGTTGEPPDPQ